MKNKGFTLIELLSVIVLLSLLALLVIPKVLEQKEKKEKEISLAKKKVLYSDAEKYLKENNEDDITPGQEFCISVETLIDEGYISMDADDLKNETVKVTVDNNSNLVSSLSNNCTDAIVIGAYTDDTLNGANPALKSDMVPVTIANDGTVTKANIKDEWYNYGDKKWANAVVLVDNTEYSAGDTIPEEKIKAYYVWIPRYKYKLFSNTTESSIEIVFENKKTTKSNSTTVGQYLTHPAFTYGDKELSGFWVGKFEPSVEISDACYIQYSIENCNKELKNVRIKPNLESLSGQQIAFQYLTSHNFSKNSNMIKNDEWGAVAYLSNSIYGKNGKIDKNGSQKYTGCGNIGSNKTCERLYGDLFEYPQSTTGNITGIFDMSGGRREYVMAVLADKDGRPFSGRNNKVNSGFNGKLSIPGSDSSDSTIIEITNGIDFPDSKDYNLYYNPNDITDDRSNTNENNGCNGNPCYGHALNEVKKQSLYTSGWYSEYVNFASSNLPWLDCGSGYNFSSSTIGIFSHLTMDGSQSNGITFRVVVR